MHTNRLLGSDILENPNSITRACMDRAHLGTWIIRPNRNQGQVKFAEFLSNFLERWAEGDLVFIFMQRDVPVPSVAAKPDFMRLVG